MGPGDVVHNRYTLRAPIGRGGMAQVWQALDERLQRPVAVKFLSPHVADDADNLVRFFSEAQSVARISHPGVVTVLDFGEHDGRPFLVMEYVAGGSLADVTGEPMDPGRACSIVARVAAAAGAAHAAGVVHRDVKPHNVLLDESGNPKLADFGIASARGHERLTATGTAVGSPHYVSPEQAMDAGTSPASDVYALGVVLYELVTGRRPFDGDSITAIVVAHVEQQPRPPHELVDGLDPAIEDVVMRCLAKDPERRYADGTQLAAALAAAAPDGAPASVSPAALAGTETVALGGVSAAPAASETRPAVARPGARPARRRNRRVLVAAGAVAAILTAVLAAVVIGGTPGDDAVATTPGEAGRSDGRKSPSGDRGATPSAPVDATTDGDEGDGSTTPEDDDGETRARPDERSGGAADDPAGGDVDEPVDDPTDEPVDDPTDEPVDDPTDDVTGADAEDRTDDPATGDAATGDAATGEERPAGPRDG